MIYELDSKPRAFRHQLRAFINDTGWTGIFKRNVSGSSLVSSKSRRTIDSDLQTLTGEDSLGVTKLGQIVRIRFDGKKLTIET